MAGKKGKAGGGTSQGSIPNDAGRGSSGVSGAGQPARSGGRGGQQASSSARQAGSATGGQPAGAITPPEGGQQLEHGGQGGQQASASASQKPASAQGGTHRSGRKGRGRSGPAGDFVTPKQLLRAMAALGLRSSRVPPQRPELSCPSLPGIALLQRIGQLSPGSKIVSSQITRPGHVTAFKFDMDGCEATSCTCEVALCLLSTALQPEHGGSVAVRCFTEEVDPATQLPVKELHGFYLRGGQAEKSSPELEWCHNTCAIDGTPLKPEPAVRFC